MDSKNSFVHPSNSLWGHYCTKILNNQKLLAFRRTLLPKLPYLELESDTVNIVYLNWLVNLDAFRDMIPEGVHIQQKNGRALFSVLTYQHSHFGPLFLGPLRQGCPSPLQSNWRFYLSEKPDASYPHLATAQQAGVVLFVKNILNSTLYTIGSRLMSDGLPSHLAQSFQHTHSDNTYMTVITAGHGSAPELFAVCKKQEKKVLPAEFQQWFSDWDSALHYLCPQHSAIAYVDHIDRIAHAGIELPIDVTQAQSLDVQQLKIPLLEREGADPSEPFAFVIPSVNLQVLWERLL